MARFVINKFVIDVLIFLFKRTANITKEFPTTPTTPIIKNNIANPITTPMLGDVTDVTIVTFGHFVLPFSKGVDMVNSSAINISHSHLQDK